MQHISARAAIRPNPVRIDVKFLRRPPGLIRLGTTISDYK